MKKKLTKVINKILFLFYKNLNFSQLKYHITKIVGKYGYIDSFISYVL